MALARVAALILAITLAVSCRFATGGVRVCTTWVPSFQDQEHRRRIASRSRTSIQPGAPHTLDGSAAPLEVNVGDKVQLRFVRFKHHREKNFVGYNAWENCEVVQVSEDGLSCSVKYPSGMVERDVDVISRVRPLPPLMQLEKGQAVEVLEQGEWVDATVVSVDKDGARATVKYVCGKTRADVDVRSQVREQRIPLGLLEVGTKFTGTVVGVMRSGVWVDIGAESNGFVPRECMTEDPYNSPRDLVVIKQKVEVYVLRLRLRNMACPLRLTMTEKMLDVYDKLDEMFPGERKPVSELKIGSKHKGLVWNYRSRGFEVDIGADAMGFVFTPYVTEDELADPRDVVSLGQVVDVWVTDVLEDSFGLTMDEGRVPGHTQDLLPFYSYGQQLIPAMVKRKLNDEMAEITIPSPDGSYNVTCSCAVNEAFAGQNIEVKIDKITDSIITSVPVEKKEPPIANPTILHRFANLPEGTWLNGRVADVAPYGLHVEVSTPGEPVSTTGLVYITQITGGFIRHPADTASVGQEVDVRVLAVDIPGRRLALSMVKA